ncbi:MAG TPA: alpha/beta hydrolase [Epsilonproteobacteria bacterium]|nr:alpha/beta hydrolase [Campylobacterota bacterium]
MPNFILDVMIEKKKAINAFEKRKFRAIVDDNMLHRDDLTETLKSIKQETLIVWGKEDLGIDVASAYKMHALIKNSTLKIYDECRHYPQLEKQKVLAKDIIEFLN